MFLFRVFLAPPVTTELIPLLKGGLSPGGHSLVDEFAHSTPFCFFLLFFTESALRPIQSIIRDVRMSLCLFVFLFVRHTLETTLPEGLETSGRRAYR